MHSLHCLCGTRTDQGVGSENEINFIFFGPTHHSEKIRVRKHALELVAWYGGNTGSMRLNRVEKNAFSCKTMTVMNMFRQDKFKKCGWLNGKISGCWAGSHGF